MNGAAIQCWLMVLCSAVFVGCAPKPYRASFVAIVAIDDRENIYSALPVDELRPNLAVNSQAQILSSFVFWRDFVTPRLPPELAGDSRLTSSRSVSVGDIRKIDDKLVAEFRIELKFGGEKTFDAILAAYPECRKSLAAGFRPHGKTGEPEFPFDRMILEVRKP